MFCEKCGAAAEEGSRFCEKCGNPLSGGAPPQYSQQGNQDEDRKKKAGGFFSTGAGIALVAILGVAVLAGITFGVILLLRGSGNDTCDAATVDVWEEYESILEEDSDDLAQISMDPNALTQNQEDLKKAQERVAALEKVLAKTGGTNTWRANTNARPVNTRDIKAAQLAAALAAYNDYIQMMDQFFGALIGAIANNQLFNADVVNNLNNMLAQLEKMAADVTRLTNTFLDGNTMVTVRDFDPPILLFAKDITPQVEQMVVEAQAAEAARIEAERVAAEQAAAAAAAEAERQRQAAEAASQPSGHWERVAVVPYPCGDPSCDICYDDVWVED